MLNFTLLKLYNLLETYSCEICTQQVKRMICRISNVVLSLEAVLFFESVRNSSFAENIVISLRCRKLNKVFSKNCLCVEYIQLDDQY